MGGLERPGAAEMASCNGARIVWFSSAVLASPGAVSPDAAVLAEVASIRDATREDEGGDHSHFVSCYLENYFGWPSFQGVYLSPHGAPVALHSWNVLPQLAILDACADRFGEGNDVTIIRPEAAEWGRYRREWTSHYNPSLADRHPELAGCVWTGKDDIARITKARERNPGEPWWLPPGASTEAFDSFRAKMAALRGEARPEMVGPTPVCR